MVSYISTDIMGGLGNQLFQIANIFLYNNFLHQKKIIIFINQDSLFNSFNFPRKTFWNSLFINQFSILNESDFNLIPFFIFNEKQNHKNLISPFSSFPHNILFKGYFQSFKYYDDNLRKQMQNLVFSNISLVNIAKNKYNDIKLFFNSFDDDNFVSIHIRRTDFILLKDFNYILELDYYYKALDFFKNKHVVVFSDDIEWCKLHLDNNFYFIDLNNVEIEFLLMSFFKHNIIANSTFSLWASFISPYDNKLIIAPKNWYGIKGPQDWSEIYHKFISFII